MFNRLIRVVAIAALVTFSAPAVTNATVPGAAWVFCADWLYPEGFWVQSNGMPEGCDTEEAGANDGYVRCANEEPGDSPDPEFAFDPQNAHSPVAILD